MHSADGMSAADVAVREVAMGGSLVLRIDAEQAEAELGIISNSEYQGAP